VQVTQRIDATLEIERIAAAFARPDPWLVPLSTLGASVIERVRSGTVAAAIDSTAAGVAQLPKFVEHDELAAGEAYEAFIARTQRVPTRNNAHDFFNALMWMSYPQTKWRLNALQAQEIARLGTRGPRGALRDALTLFDENAALLQAPGELIEALCARQWKTLFVEQRSLWREARLVLFGHALLEKLLRPRKAITAHVWIVDDVVDVAVAASLDPERLVAKPFAPLPVLGVPGWWPENESPSFYDDPTVFRAAK
jgi:hypothetical protein